MRTALIYWHGIKSFGKPWHEMDRTVILTPHIGEFARLYGCSIAQVKKHLTDYPLELSRRLHCTVVCKDARTIVVCPEGKE